MAKSCCKESRRIGKGMNRVKGRAGGYTVAEFERMQMQENFVMHFDWQDKAGRVFFHCEIDPNTWFNSSWLMEEIQERLESEPWIPLGTFSIRFKAGQSAYETLTRALPECVTGAVAKHRSMKSNEFSVTLSMRPRQRYTPAHAVDRNGPMPPEDPDVLVEINEFLDRLKIPRRKPLTGDGEQIVSRMDITRPRAPFGPATRLSFHCFALAFGMILFMLLWFLDQGAVAQIAAAIGF